MKVQFCLSRCHHLLALALLVFGCVQFQVAASELRITSFSRAANGCVTLNWISETGRFYTVYSADNLCPPVFWRVAATMLPSGGTNTTWRSGCCDEEMMMMSGGSSSSSVTNGFSEKEIEELIAARQSAAAEGAQFLLERLQEAAQRQTNGSSSLSSPSLPPGGGTNTNYVATVVTAKFFRVAQVSCGVVDGWGVGVGTIPDGLTNVVAVAAGSYDSGSHNLALKAEGTVVAWGNNRYGQTNVPAGLTK